MRAFSVMRTLRIVASPEADCILTAKNFSWQKTSMANMKHGQKRHTSGCPRLPRGRSRHRRKQVRERDGAIRAHSLRACSGGARVCKPTTNKVKSLRAGLLLSIEQKRKVLKRIMASSKHAEGKSTKAAYNPVSPLQSPHPRPGSFAPTSC